MNIIFLILFIFLIALIFLLFKFRHAYRNINEQLFVLNNKIDNNFLQIEALLGLYVDLRLNSSLPPTRGWAASPDFLRVVAKHSLKYKPMNVVECSSGVSTIVLARCMQINGFGHVYSLDHEEKYARQTQSVVNDMGLSDWVTVIHAPICMYKILNEDWPWYSLSELQKNTEIDMLVIDGPVESLRSQARYPAGHLLFPFLNNKSFVFLDDASRHDEQLIVSAWAKDFNMNVSFINCEKGCAVLTSNR